MDELNKIKIIANRRILERTKTSIIEEEKLFDITDKKIFSIYNKNKNKSILIFFNKIFNESNDNCKLIENIQDEIIKKLLLFDMVGISYYMKLDKNHDNYK
jgi:arabinogalactan endo-1,4-beta-galactosidase